MRYVGYVRISSEEQRGNYSLAAQNHAIESWVARQKDQLAGQLIRIYEEECRTGMNDQRDAFQQMLRDARDSQFDAIVVHKWDRLARLRCDAIRYKFMLRREYGIKLFAVEGISEDEDEYMGMFFEAMTEVWGELYSRNLSRETKKGKSEKAHQGRHNNIAPFGTDQSQEGILCPDAKEQPGLMLAMESYSTSQQSDRQVAEILNTAGYVTKQGKPFTTEMVREMLQNRTYIGFIRYQPYRKRPDGSRDSSAQTEWFPGQHKPIIPIELFERCQEARRQRQHYPRNAAHCSAYPLSGLLYCKECGKRLRAQRTPSGKRYYHCIHPVNDRCVKRMVLAETLEEKVAHLISRIDLPDNWRMMNYPSTESYAQSDQRRNELQQSLERLDFRWDMGFIDKEDYLAKRKALQLQLRNNQPISERDLIEAEALLRKFNADWETVDLGHRKEFFIALIESAWVSGGTIKGIKLRSPFTFLARHATNIRIDAEGFLVTQDAI
jgi:site-specific DNA recombinase